MEDASLARSSASRLTRCVTCPAESAPDRGDPSRRCTMRNIRPGRGRPARARAAEHAGAAQYPNKPITVIVPFAAGGPTDVVARLVGEHMSRTLGQTLRRRECRRRRRHPRHDPRRAGAAGRLHHRGRQHGHAVGGARALSEPQVRSGQELRAGRHRQLHAAGDRRQEGDWRRPISRTSSPTCKANCVEAELRPRRRRLDLARVGPGVQRQVRPHARR